MLSTREREELRDRLDDWFDLPLLLAAVVLVLLIVIEATQPLRPPWDRYVEWIGLAIWLLFGVEFALRLWLSPDRWAYLRSHWLDALAVALPAFRVFRVVRAARGARGVRALRLLVFGSRGADELIERLRKRKLGKLATVSAFVVLIGAALLFLSEQAPGSPIQTFGDALYWATMMVVGTEGGLDMRTTLGRVVTIGLIGYSIVVFSYLIGAVASLWVERDREDRERRQATVGIAGGGDLPPAMREARGDLPPGDDGGPG